MVKKPLIEQSNI